MPSKLAGIEGTGTTKLFGTGATKKCVTIADETN